MLKIERFINELMSSNCYIVWDDSSLRCIVIDPASEKSLREIEFIESHNLILDNILLTHEHTDHTWGVNALLDKYPSARVICTETCKKNLPKAGDTYFRLYYERNDYTYSVRKVDYTCEELNWKLDWDRKTIKFINTPGHSFGSVCIDIQGYLFTGDTIMQTKPYVNKRNGDIETYRQSVSAVLSIYNTTNTIVHPGHGDIFHLNKLAKL